MLPFSSAARQRSKFLQTITAPYTIMTGIRGRLALILLMTALGFVAIGTVSYLVTEEVNERWGYFRDNVAKRLELLENIRQHVGYGGMIHHFKNFVLRKQEEYLIAFDLSYMEVEKALVAYAQLDLSDQERGMLIELHKTFDAYDKLRFYILEDMAESNVPSSTIDTQVKVDDKPALQAMQVLNDAVEALKEQETELLEQHLAETQQVIFAVIIITMLIVIVVTFLTARTILYSLQEAGKIANNIAAGNLDNQISYKTKDETGRLLEALGLMQTQLRDQIAQEQQITKAALRINQALESVATSVVIADANYQIIYANPAAQTLFQTHADILRQHLPHGSLGELIAQPLAVLYPNGTQQYEWLNQLTHSVHTQLDISDLTLEYTVTPVFNEAGERVGLVKEFHDRTEEVNTQVEIKQVIEAASQGDFSQRVDLADKGGFFRSFSEGLNQTMDYNQQAIRDVMRLLAALAQGDLTHAITNDYQGELEQLKNDANLTTRKLTETLDTIQQIADVVNEAADNLSNNSLHLSQQSEEQAASLEETAASMEQMNATVQQNTDNVRRAQQVAAQVAEQATQGGQGVTQAINAMQAIKDSSRKVNDIIGVIDEIAFQTNLLALNAAVEAARAGEQGRGFAVVANEVRNLAQRSAVAAKEIKTLIGDSVNKIAEGTRLVSESGEMLTEMLSGVQQVNEFMLDIASASQDQASGIGQVTRSITQMEQTTQQSTHLVQETTLASEGMAKQAQLLRERVAFFTL